MVMSLVLVLARSDAGDEVCIQWDARPAVGFDQGESGFRLVFRGGVHARRRARSRPVLTDRDRCFAGRDGRGGQATVEVSIASAMQPT